ncbi:unnamed protein product [Caenorhabditis nigoni]
MLTKLSSICVLEYLSFEKRQYIVPQIPGFRKAEKSWPLHLDTLRISVDEIQLDKNKYFLKRRINVAYYHKLIQWDLNYQHEVLPGDFCVGFPQNHIFRQISETRKPPPLWRTELQMERHDPEYSNTSMGYLPPVYDTSPIHAAFKKVVNDLIGNRPIICTKKLEFEHLSFRDIRERGGAFKIYRLPEGLKIRAEILESSCFSFSYAELDQLSRILGSKPLKEFSTQLENLEIFQHPIVRNSEKLVLWSGRMDFNHEQINHRHIHLKNYYSVFDHINAWMGNNNEVGKEFSGDIRLFDSSTLTEKEISIKRMMYLKKCESGGRRVKPDRRFPNTLYSISVPRSNNRTIEVQMSLLKNGSKDYPFQIHLKTQPSRTAIPKQIDSMYLELKIWEPRKRIGNFLENLPRNVSNAISQMKKCSWNCFLMLCRALVFLLGWISVFVIGALLIIFLNFCYFHLTKNDVVL